MRLYEIFSGIPLLLARRLHDVKFIQGQKSFYSDTDAAAAAAPVFTTVFTVVSTEAAAEAAAAPAAAPAAVTYVSE